ncbi:uncharacterized protein [Gossypium hirsutum]|uniref:Tf2-1-like SH3-like domain-containing protein n=1 Tax=Gossypium hirsutum TaxID=3635 RepID=A0A1U8NN86_GOSHI|nr:uncharacterized protein LOC107950092 [Gossypium hirsutum]
MKEISFEVGDKVFLKVFPWKRIIHFGQKGKLSPKFIGPCEILDKVWPMAYRLALPLELSKIHDVFHISMLCRYRSNLKHIVQIEELKMEPILSYKEKLIRNLAKEVKELRNKRILLVKLLWRNNNIEEATWERESVMRGQYPQLHSGEVHVKVSLVIGEAPSQSVSHPS